MRNLWALCEGKWWRLVHWGIEAMEGWGRSLSSFWAFRDTKSMRENKHEA
ncbi:hypothetical protein [Bartonella sp. AS69XJJH]